MNSSQSQSSSPFPLDFCNRNPIQCPNSLSVRILWRDRSRQKQALDLVESSWAHLKQFLLERSVRKWLKFGKKWSDRRELGWQRLDWEYRLKIVDTKSSSIGSRNWLMRILNCLSLSSTLMSACLQVKGREEMENKMEVLGKKVLLSSSSSTNHFDFFNLQRRSIIVNNWLRKRISPSNRFI